MKDYTWGAIIPLVGGFPIGFQRYTGKLPEFIASYPDFEANDQHYFNYARQHGFDEDIINMAESDSVPYVDVVTSTCPCAGLSSLSKTSGSDNPANDWMLKSSAWVLKNVRPKLLIGENAPRLASESGREFRERLQQVGFDQGYSLSLYKTKSEYHGSNQLRARSYFMFTKGGAVNIPTFHRKSQIFEHEVFNPPTKSNDPMNVAINKQSLDNNVWVNCSLKLSGTNSLQEFYDVIESSKNLKAYTMFHEEVESVRDIIGKYAPKYVKKFDVDLEKIRSGRNLWLHGFPTVIRTDKNPTYGTFVAGLPENMINHKQNRYITFREGIRAMGMPEDFDLVNTSNSNVLCQNVCVEVSTDMADACGQIVDGFGKTNEQFKITDNKPVQRVKDLQI